MEENNMTNKEKYNNAFVKGLGVKEDILETDKGLLLLRQNVKLQP